MREKKKGRKDKGTGGSLCNGYENRSLNSLKKLPRGTQVKRDGLAITVERRGTSSGIALRYLSCPWLHVRSVKDHTRRETFPRGVGLRGQTLKTIRTESARGSPHKLPVHPNYT